MEILSKVSTSSMHSVCLFTRTTIAALPAFRRAKRNLRSACLSSGGMSTVLLYSACTRRGIAGRGRGRTMAVVVCRRRRQEEGCGN
jgi:hypothetical protein